MYSLKLIFFDLLFNITFHDILYLKVCIYYFACFIFLYTVGVINVFFEITYDMKYTLSI